MAGWGSPCLSWTPLSDHGPPVKHPPPRAACPRLRRWKADPPGCLTSVDMIRLPRRPPSPYSFPVFLGDPETPDGSHLQLIPEEASFPHHTLLMWSGSPSPNRGVGVGVGAGTPPVLACPLHTPSLASALSWHILLPQHPRSFSSCTPHPGDCVQHWD